MNRGCEAGLGVETLHFAMRALFLMGLMESLPQEIEANLGKFLPWKSEPRKPNPFGAGAIPLMRARFSAPFSIAEAIEEGNWMSPGQQDWKLRLVFREIEALRSS